VPLERAHGPVDDRRVVAEEKAARRRDRRDEDDVPQPRGTRRGDRGGATPHWTRMFEIASKNFETSTMSLPRKTTTLPAGRSTPGSIATTSATTISLKRIRSFTGRATRYGLISLRRSTPRFTPSRIRFWASSG